MSIKEKERKYAEDFCALYDPFSQGEYLIELGIGSPDEQEIRRDRYRIEGCKTGIWMEVFKEDNLIHFRADSDSVLVKGVLHIYKDLYEGKRETEIQENPPEFLKCISDDVIYPEIRENGLFKCYRKMAHFENRTMNILEEEIKL